MPRRFQFSLETLMLLPLFFGGVMVIASRYRRVIACLAADIWSDFRQMAVGAIRHEWPSVQRLAIVFGGVAFMSALMAAIRYRNRGRDDACV